MPARHDFPAKWQTLLPDLIAKLQAASADVETTYGVLETANAVFKRYRNQVMTSELSQDLQYSQQFVQPLLDALTILVQQITSPPAAAPAADATRRQVLAARLACRTFFSLNSPGLTQVHNAMLFYGNAVVRKQTGAT